MGPAEARLDDIIRLAHVHAVIQAHAVRLDGDHEVLPRITHDPISRDVLERDAVQKSLGLLNLLLQLLLCPVLLGLRGPDITDFLVLPAAAEGGLDELPLPLAVEELLYILPIDVAITVEVEVAGAEPVRGREHPIAERLLKARQMISRLVVVDGIFKHHSITALCGVHVDVHPDQPELLLTMGHQANEATSTDALVLGLEDV
mmetsp:Transcript_68165/g.197613  ORF Transcript_68165/g.197613 Transcript_68165/m.197613 type:complete len:203 (-) Transcript_68165:310-918(-)